MHVKCPFSAAIAIDVEPLRQEVALGHWYIIRYQNISTVSKTVSKQLLCVVSGAISAARRRSQSTTSYDIGRLALSDAHKRTLTASSAIILTLGDSGSGSGAYPQPQRRATYTT